MQTYIKLLKDKYSNHFFKVIMSMLESNHLYRPDMSKILDTLRPYEQ